MNRITKTILLLFIALQPLFIAAQDTNKDFNLGLEEINYKTAMPNHWFMWGIKTDYSITPDSSVKHSGKYAMLLQGLPGKTDASSFGCLATTIPAMYDGAEVEVSAWFKLQDVKSGSIGLLLRIDGASGTLQFDNMQEKHINGTIGWTQYSVKLPLPKTAKNISIGGILSGDGKLWMDDFKVTFDGTDISKAPIKHVVVLPAEKDHRFDSGSGITSIPISPGSVKIFNTLCRVWGFLKYYDPPVMKGNYNWDYELFRIMPDVMKCDNLAQCDDLLCKLIDKTGIPKNGTAQWPASTDDVKLKPDIAWINDTMVLGGALSQRLNTIKELNRPSDSYYVGFSNNAGNPDFSNENPYNYMKHPDAGFRMLALFRYWNMIEYYYPNRHLMGDNWDSVLNAFIPRFAADTGLLYHLDALKLIACIHDTHANVWNDPVLENHWGYYYAPVALSFIGGQPVVTDYLKSADSTKTPLRIGDIIIQVNHKNITDIIKERLPYTAASNYPTQLRNIARDLLRTTDSTLNITYLRGSQTYNKQLKCLTYPYYPGTATQHPGYKLIGHHDIGYIYPASLTSDKSIDTVMKKFMHTKGIVIDMRCYPRHFLVYSLTKYLMPKPTPFVKFTMGSIAQPGMFKYAGPQSVGKDKKDYYKGKVVVLVNQETQSQAEYTTMAIRVAPGAKVIGSTTAGADGDVSGINLPGGIHTLISGIGILYPDGKETQRVGIVPDISIMPTVNGIRSGKDELLDKALEVINQK